MVQKKKTKIRHVNVSVKKGTFVSKLIRSKKSPDFSDIKLLRNLLSTEKAKILYTIKSKNPKSIYHLAQILNRDLKSVRRDIKTLKNFGFLEFRSEKKDKKKSLKPVLIIERLQIIIDL
jgi:predicted transcriptional regulator